MAAITASAVTPIYSGDLGDRQGKFVSKMRRLKVALAAQGATAGDIPAAVLGFKRITKVECYAATIGGQPRAGLFFVANIDSDNNYVYPIDLLQATDASRNNPANLTGDFWLEVEGIPL